MKCNDIAMVLILMDEMDGTGRLRKKLSSIIINNNKK